MSTDERVSAVDSLVLPGKRSMESMTSVVSDTPPLDLLRMALADFYTHDRALLRLNAGETALTFRLAHHLALRVNTSWDVDAEYDRQSDGASQKSRGATTMRPDVVVHRRGQLGFSNNLLFVEVKRNWSGYGDREDHEKAGIAITRHCYQVAVVLGLRRAGVDRLFSPIWTVYGASPEDHHESCNEPVLIARALAVFDDASLEELDVDAVLVEKTRTRALRASDGLPATQAHA